MLHRSKILPNGAEKGRAMQQTTQYPQFPRVPPIVRRVTHRFARLTARVLVAMVALIAAIVTFGPVVLTLTATALVPVVFVLRPGVALP